MPANVLYKAGTTVETILSTGLNSLANNARAMSAAITITDTLYIDGELELYISGMGGVPTANTTLNVWFLRQIDATNYEDGDASTTPARNPDAFFPIRAVSTAQRIVRVVTLPPGVFKVLIINAGTGQALAAADNTLKLKPHTVQI